MRGSDSLFTIRTRVKTVTKNRGPTNENFQDINYNANSDELIMLQKEFPPIPVV